jgi:hypothetical protein
MKKKVSLAIWSFIGLIVFIFTFFAISYFFNPHLEKKISILGCNESYKRFYVFDNSYEYEKTFGHAQTNDFNYHNAKMRLALCLCEKYEENKDQRYATEIIKIFKEYKEN